MEKSSFQYPKELNFFYKKWILGFEFDPNIWIEFKF